MSVVMGQEACLREAGIAGDRADTAATSADNALPNNDSRAASLALVSIAYSARELCFLARLAVDRLTDKK